MRKTAMLLVLVLLAGGLASEAQAFGWSDFKARLGIDQEQEQEQAQARERAMEGPSEVMTGEQEGIPDEIGEEGSEEDTTGLLLRGVQAVNQNPGYIETGRKFGYKRVCIEVTDTDGEESYTADISGDRMMLAVGCAGEDFTAKVEKTALRHLVLGLETGSSTILGDIYREGRVEIPFRVKLKVMAKCAFSSVC